MKYTLHYYRYGEMSKLQAKTLAAAEKLASEMLKMNFGMPTAIVDANGTTVRELLSGKVAGPRIRFT